MAMLPGARIVGLWREPVETCWSCYKQLFAKGLVGFAYDFESLAAYWRDYDRLSRFWAKNDPLRFRALSNGRVAGASLGPFPYAGDGGSVQVADHRPLDSFEVRTAATFRFAIDAAALDEALASLAPGQSEHPGHPHQSDALLRWLTGRPSLLATSPLVVEETAVAELRLEPPAETGGP